MEEVVLRPSRSVGVEDDTGSAELQLRSRTTRRVCGEPHQTTSLAYFRHRSSFFRTLFLLHYCRLTDVVAPLSDSEI